MTEKSRKLNLAEWLIASPMTSLEQKLFEQHGPVIGGSDLYAALGYKGYSAFYRAKELDALGVKVFHLPGRKGWFAFSSEVAAWLSEQAQAQTTNESTMTNGGHMKT